MGSSFPLDRRLVEFLNGNAQGQPWRLLATMAAKYFIVVPLAIAVFLMVRAIRRRDTHTLTILILGAGGTVLALLANVAVNHLYFRLRPYWAISSVHAIGSRTGQSSLFSDHAVIAAIAFAVLLVSRRWGLAATAAAVAVGVGRVAVGAHYPSDVLAGFAISVSAVALLLFVRRPVQRLLDRFFHQADTPPARHHEMRAGAAAAIVLALLGGWLVGHIQDHGVRTALSRAEGRLADRLPSDVRLYKSTDIETLATGGWGSTRARVSGQVSYTTREPDGDIHVILKAPDHSFVVLEIIPELPLEAPHDDDRITAWGVVRFDSLHSWWELHPLIGWSYGVVDTPATEGLDD